MHWLLLSWKNLYQYLSNYCPPSSAIKCKKLLLNKSKQNSSYFQIMAQIHHATLRTKAQPSLPSSARSNAGPLHSRSAALRIPCQSKRRVALSIVCSNSGSTDTVTVEKQASSVPAGAILGRSSFPTDFAFGTASSAYQVSIPAQELISRFIFY